MGSNVPNWLVRIGTDGATANVAGAGLKGLVEKELPWIFWMWCMAIVDIFWGSFHIVDKV